MNRWKDETSHHLWTGQMSEVTEPIDSSPAVIKGVNQFMRDHSIHMSLLVNVVLTQNNLDDRDTCEKTHLMFVYGLMLRLIHLRCGSIKASTDGPITILTGEMSVFINCTEKKSHLIIFKHIVHNFMSWHLLLPAGTSHGSQQEFSIWIWLTDRDKEEGLYHAK